MKILVVSQYFWPESFIINDIVRILHSQGHEVVVATGKPNYPDGKIFTGYRAWGTKKEKYLENIEIFRVPLWPRGKGNAINLVLNYISFVIAGTLLFPWQLRGRKFDAILVFGLSPITQAIPAILLKKIKKTNLSIWVQDLWPESLEATGFIKNHLLLRFVGWIVKGIYQCCDTILVQSKAFFEPVSRYADPKKLFYYPNSIARSEKPGIIKLDQDLVSLLDQHFCIVFAGNLGTAQALDTLVEVAAQLQDENDIRLVLVGSGTRLEWLREQKLVRNLTNLVLPGRLPSEVMPEVFSHASALLVSLNDNAIFAQTIPSKIQAYLAAGRPIIGALNGEGARIICEAGAGLVSPAGQVAALVSIIRSMKKLTESERTAMGTSGRKYFNEHFDMESQVTKLVSLLQNKGGYSV